MKERTRGVGFIGTETSNSNEEIPWLSSRQRARALIPVVSKPFCVPVYANMLNMHEAKAEANRAAGVGYSPRPPIRAGTSVAIIELGTPLKELWQRIWPVNIDIEVN